MEKEIFNQVQEAQRVPYRINPRRNTPRHILIKLKKTTHKSNLNKFKKIEIISSIFSDYNTVRLDRNYKKKTVKTTNT